MSAPPAQTLPVGRFVFSLIHNRVGVARMGICRAPPGSRSSKIVGAHSQDGRHRERDVAAESPFA